MCHKSCYWVANALPCARDQAWQDCGERSPAKGAWCGAASGLGWDLSTDAAQDRERRAAGFASLDDLRVVCGARFTRGAARQTLRGEIMSQQLSLGDYYAREIPPAVRHSRVSREAAARIAPRVSALQLVVLAHMVGTGRHGATDEESQLALKMNPSTQRPRRIELGRAGLIVDAGETRPTKSGRAARVYRVTEKGQAWQEADS